MPAPSGRARRGRACARALGIFLLLGCGAACADALVFAAASLKNALDEQAARYRERGGRPVRIAYAASSALARQIEAGAPADLFISADLAWMDHLERAKRLAPGSRVNLLRNRLVLVAPAGSRASFAIGPGFPLDRLLGEGRLALADPDHVPAGRYARAALAALGVWDKVAGRLARADNVRAALNFVARGEAPFGVVYHSDAAATRDVRVIGTFPASSHPPIVYPAALVSGAAGADGAAFLRYLTTPEAGAIFRKHAFEPY